jgi:hypothetical protein
MRSVGILVIFVSSVVACGGLAAQSQGEGGPDHISAEASGDVSEAHADAVSEDHPDATTGGSDGGALDAGGDASMDVTLSSDAGAADAGTCEFLDGAVGTCNDPTALYVCCPYLPGRVGCVLWSRFDGGCQPAGAPP